MVVFYCSYEKQKTFGLLLAPKGRTWNIWKEVVAAKTVMIPVSQTPLNAMQLKIYLLPLILHPLSFPWSTSHYRVDSEEQL